MGKRSMYQSYPALVIGFHGCDRSIGEKLLSGNREFKPSTNEYDWLGNGMYFWENSFERAKHYANEVKNNPQRGKIQDPFVLGAVLDLGRCMNLLDYHNLSLLKPHYRIFEKIHIKQNRPMPQNRHGEDKLLRHLDCAVIEFTLQMLKNGKESVSFDSVRAVFVEGEKLYPDAGFNEKNHIQLCIRNPNCIKGFFRPRDPVNNYPRV